MSCSSEKQELVSFEKTLPNEIDDNLNKSLLKYFEKYLPSLEKDYVWRKSTYLENMYGISGKYCQEVKGLKLIFYNLWKEANEESKVTLAKEVIDKWGGIRRNNPGTIESYVEWIHSGTESWPLKGVASYSKILAIFNPEKYAIYDARVATSLIAAQYIYGNGKGMIFNYVKSQNSVIKKFSNNPRFSKEALEVAGWIEIPDQNNYMEYISTLRNIEKHLRGKPSFNHFRLYDLEMSLFANATKLAEKAISHT